MSIVSDTLGTNPTSSNGSNFGITLSSGSGWGAAASVVDSLITNLTNYGISKQNKQLQVDTNAQNEALMRESWARDDSAVQRRVADLKAAGISPLLAAGSAAGNSGPIQLNAPQNNFQMKQLGLVSALTAAQQLKGMALDNQLKALNVRYYGMPDWLVAIQRAVGELPKDNVFRQFVEKGLNWLSGLFPSESSGSSSPSGFVPVDQDPVKIDRSPVTPKLKEKEFAPKSNFTSFYVDDKSIKSEAEDLVKSAIQRGGFSSRLVFSIARILSKRYDVSEDIALDYVFDAWDKYHEKDEPGSLNFIK